VTEDLIPTSTAFSNEQISPKDIPTMSTLEYSKLQPAYRNVLLISTTVFFVVFASIFAGLTFTGNEFFQQYVIWFVLGASILWLISLILVLLGFKKKSYALRERDLVYNEGLIWHSSTVIPFNRVQHCEISQGPIERLFKLAELKIFTAGGSSSDMSVPGLDPATANRLKEFIILKTGLNNEEEE